MHVDVVAALQCARRQRARAAADDAIAVLGRREAGTDLAESLAELSASLAAFPFHG